MDITYPPPHTLAKGLVALYLYYCSYCDYSFELKKPMAKAGEDEKCPQCGIKAMRKYTPVIATFGWRLQQKCHEVGQTKWAEIERDL